MEINMLAVVAAAVSSFIIGGLWYSPMLFGKKRIRKNMRMSTVNSLMDIVIRICLIGLKIHSFIKRLMMTQNFVVQIE